MLSKIALFGGGVYMWGFIVPKESSQFETYLYLNDGKLSVDLYVRILCGFTLLFRLAFYEWNSPLALVLNYFGMSREVLLYFF